MKLTGLDVYGFGKLTNRHFDFDGNMNVIYGPNEAGKSTLYSCIRAMFFGMPRAIGVAAYSDEWSRFKPWSGEKYGGVLRIQYNDKEYEIHRDFNDNPVGCRIVDEDGNELENPQAFLDEVFGNITPAVYDNTISIGQLQNRPDESVAPMLRDFIINMNTTGNQSLNCDRAKAFLAEQRRDLADKLDTDAAKTYASNMGEIKGIESELGKPQNMRLAIELENALNAEKEKAEANSKERLDLSFSMADNIRALRSNHLNNLQDVEHAKKRFEAVVTDYLNERNSHKVELFRILWIICLLIAAALGTYAVRGSFFKNDVPLANLVLAAAGAAIALVLFVVFICLCNSAKRTLKSKKEDVADFMIVYGNHSEVTDESINELSKKLDDFAEIGTKLEDQKTQMDSLTAAQNDIEKKVADANEVLNVELENRAQLTSLILKLNELRDKNKELRSVLEHNDEINDKLEAIDIAVDTLSNLSSKMKDSFGLFLNQTASDYIRDITGGAYGSLHLDNDMNVTLNCDGRLVPIDQVSHGTADQIYLAIRMACAQLLQGGKSSLPMIFDDSFVNCDKDRLKASLKWIAEQCNAQILLFTCHERELSALDELDIDCNKVEL